MNAGGSGATRRAGLLGRVLGHSLSPQVHRLFCDCEYGLYEREPEEVESFLRGSFGRGGFDFLNVTIPYKKLAFSLCGELSPEARALGNVNLVARGDGGALRGDNTDAFGAERLLDSAGVDAKGVKCAVLGAGGAAATMKAVLERRGAASVQLVRRGESPAKDAELIVNATPVGMFPDVDGTRIDIARWPECRYVVDLVYNPSPTRLVREARALGKIAVDGMVMLIAQAYRAHPGCGSRPLFLYGAPASGKSTAAKQIAAATGWRLIDLDREISRREGCGIPEIFAKSGEKGFRAAEKAALEEVLAGARGGETAVALGGGALLDGGCRAMVEATGRVVVLDCPLTTLKNRLTGGERPLSDGAAALEALVAARAPHYASFANHVSLTPDVDQ
ncbi:MAG: hypothetical protein J6T01_00080 [Kiritimatiellae bacterium]|nr:hypothetical protein [Kiritimatiellia bacterium]